MISTITSKGQVTIPKEIRNSLNLHTGDRIDFTLNETGEAVLRPIVDQIHSIVGIIQVNKKATVEEMNQAIGKRMREKRTC